MNIYYLEMCRKAADERKARMSDKTYRNSWQGKVEVAVIRITLAAATIAISLMLLEKIFIG